MAKKLPRLVVSGMSGDSGKTVVTLSLLAALKQRQCRVSVFKKGPDYIDPAWLSFVSGTVCRNLDTFLVSPDRVFEKFTSRASASRISIIEGNRGLFDGIDTAGTSSTAELAKFLHAPVILVINTTKTTRTAAALVAGCMSFDHEVNVAGVILNKVAGDRHRRIVADSIEKYCRIPVLGAIPRLGDDSELIPGRHLGLVTPEEFEWGGDLEMRLREIAENFIDVDRLIEIADGADTLEVSDKKVAEAVPVKTRIGVFRDSVFTFYYPENLDALSAQGAELVPVSSMDDSCLPEIDALYIGGGFPETHAQELAGNSSMMESVRSAADHGLPIYAECGGLMYLSSSVEWGGSKYPMSGVFPVQLRMYDKPVGHGYTRIQVDQPNPFFEVGTEIKGHEFHYSGVTGEAKPEWSCMKIQRGVGLGNERDGLLYKNTLACYTHIHSDGVGSWAPSVVSRAEEYREKNKNQK